MALRDGCWTGLPGNWSLRSPCLKAMGMHGGNPGLASSDLRLEPKYLSSMTNFLDTQKRERDVTLEYRSESRLPYGILYIFPIAYLEHCCSCIGSGQGQLWNSCVIWDSPHVIYRRLTAVYSFTFQYILLRHQLASHLALYELCSKEKEPEFKVSNWEAGNIDVQQILQYTYRRLKTSER
jgi:hypothetical protein